MKGLNQPRLYVCLDCCEFIAEDRLIPHGDPEYDPFFYTCPCGGDPDDVWLVDELRERLKEVA